MKLTQRWPLLAGPITSLCKCHIYTSLSLFISKPLFPCAVLHQPLTSPLPLRLFVCTFTFVPHRLPPGTFEIISQTFYKSRTLGVGGTFASVYMDYQCLLFQDKMYMFPGYSSCSSFQASIPAGVQPAGLHHS